MSTERESPLLRAVRSRWTYLTLLALFVTVGVVSEVRNLAGPDIAFFLYAAGRVVDGARLYRDVVEINPPLIVALNVPPVLLARMTGWSEISCYRLLTTALLLGSLLLSAAVLRRIVPHKDEPFRRWVVGLLCFVLFVVGASDYGQREHLLLALVFPYLLLAAARGQGVVVAAPLAVGIGILAGLGFSLKPHFLLVWLAVEACRLTFQHGRRPLLRLESVALGLTLLAYAGITVLVTPEYFDLVRLLAPDYRRFLAVPFGELLLSARRAPLLLLAVLVCIGLASRARYRELWIVLLLASVAGFVAAAAQQKGWRYHFYPSLGTAYVLLGVAAVDARERIADRVRLLYATMAFAVSATGVIWFTGVSMRRAAGLDPEQKNAKARFAEIAGALTSRNGGSGLFVFSFATGSGFPLVNYTGLEWTSRFPQLWLLVATYWDRLTAEGPLGYHERDRMAPAERFLNDAVYQDLAVHRPALLLVLRHARDVKANGPRRIDYLGYFGRDPRTAELLRQYRFVSDVGEYGLYERIPAGEPPLDRLPPARPGTLDLPPRRPRGWNGLLVKRDLLIQLLLFSGLGSLALLTRRRGRAKDAQ
jgi:hypothetical protein